VSFTSKPRDTSPAQVAAPEPVIPARVSLAEAPVTAAPAPSPAPAAPPEASPDAAPAEPATDNAIISFANTPGEHCGTCETVKISVAASGKVLIERGKWGYDHRNWIYRRSTTNVGPERAAAFAARLGVDRPNGDQLLAGDATCPATEDDGLTIEWISSARHDLLTVQFRCPTGRDSQLAERLRHAPDLLGLREPALPWEGGR